MKHLSLSFAAAASVFLMASCGQPAGSDQLVGDYSNKMNYKAPSPIGMVAVPTGVLKSGYSDQDMEYAMDAEVRTFQMSAFWMDATEITNAEYRQFTSWVRDSIAHATLGNYADNEDGTQQIDWKVKINWKDADVQDNLMGMYIPAEQSPTGRKTFDVTKWVYGFKYYDFNAAGRNPNQPIENFWVNSKPVQVYPDTTVWIRQFAFSNNEPIAAQYNWFPAFDEYPVVGVSWHQANAFCDWRTKLWKSGRERRNMFFEGQFRLPTEIEWEWAARGGRVLSPYPWGGPYVVNKKGCHLANFKPNRGDYSADGGLYTVKATAYWPNDYGLYNMSGNVAEWTSSTYYQDAYGKNVYADMNPEVQHRASENEPVWMTRKVVKGGSWRDAKYYLNVANRDYEYADTAKAYIGFRCVYGQVAGAVLNQLGK